MVKATKSGGQNFSENKKIMLGILFLPTGRRYAAQYIFWQSHTTNRSPLYGSWTSLYLRPAANSKLLTAKSLSAIGATCL